MSKYLSTALSIAIFLIFAFTLFSNSLNFPSFDDYDATLGFIKRFYFDDKHFASRLGFVFERHNEHRILFSKLISASYYGIFGEINFSHLVIIQNIFLLAFFGLVIMLYKKQDQLTPAIYLLITILFFDLSFWQVSFYYWAGAQHFPVFLFSFLALIMLDKSEKALSGPFLLAALFACCAAFSFGNGFLVLLTGSFLLFAKRKYTVLISWLVLSLVLIYIVFFVHKHTGVESHSTFNIEWMARLLFAFTGSFLYINPPAGQYINIGICMIAGAIILAYWVWLFFSGYAFRKPLLYSFLSLPILSGIIISISRFETKAAGGIAPRYMFFTATIPVMLLLILLDKKVLKKKVVPYISAAGLLLWGADFYNNKMALKSSNAEITATIHQWKQDKNTRLVYYLEPGEYSNMMQWAIENGVVTNSLFQESVKTNK